MSREMGPGARWQEIRPLVNSRGSQRKESRKLQADRKLRYKGLSSRPKKGGESRGSLALHPNVNLCSLCFPLDKTVLSHSVVSDSLQPHIACQAPLSMEFSRQEYWSGLPFPPPGDLTDPGIEPRSPALQSDILPSEPPGKLVLSNKQIQGWNIH